jgi:hypothetical protein
VSFALAVFVVVVFAVTIERLDLTDRGREAASRAADCLAILRDASLDDAAKERRLQDHARRLFALIGILGGGGALGILLPLGVVWLLERAGLASLGTVLAVLQRVDFLVGTTVVGLVGFLLYRRFS